MTARVLFVEINEDGSTGGSHRALFDLITGLDRARYEPVVVLYQDSDYARRFREIGADVHIWERERASERAGRGPWWMPWRLFSRVRAIARRRRFLLRQRIALVHINNSPAYTHSDWLPASRSLNIPCISHVRADFPSRMRFFEFALVRRFDRLLAISDYIADHLREQGMPDELISLVYDGVDADDLRARLRRSPADVRRDLGVRANDFLILMAGHLRAWKGQDVLLRAVAALDIEMLAHVHVVFAGAPDQFDPEYIARLRELVSTPALCDRVHLLGPRSDVADLMRAADVVVHASTVPEPFGLVVVEALALGKPVVASALGTPGSIVRPGSGWIFDPARPEDLTAILRKLFAEPATREAVRAHAIARSEDFAISQTVRGVENVYAELLDRGAVKA